MNKPFLEVTTKFEKFDRNITTEEALEISNITEEELQAIFDVVLKVDALIEREAAKNGLIHVDGFRDVVVLLLLVREGVPGNAAEGLLDLGPLLG